MSPIGSNVKGYTQPPCEVVDVKVSLSSLASSIHVTDPCEAAFQPLHLATALWRFFVGPSPYRFWRDFGVHRL